MYCFNGEGFVRRILMPLAVSSNCRRDCHYRIRAGFAADVRA
jgi:hypothetical protein